MSTLKFENVNKIYDNDVQAVFDFNLDVENKEFVVFVGPSGCGKSTTLRMVAGLEDITYGNLYIDGKLVNEVLPKNRDIAMVFQNYALFPHMTVYQNMAFALIHHKAQCPIYEPNVEADAIRQENVELYKKIKAMKKVIAKQQNSPLFGELDQLYDKVFENEKKIKEMSVQIIGIDEERIKFLEKELSRFEDELIVLQKSFAEKGEDEEEKPYLEAIELKNSVINTTKKELDYLKGNEVPLCKSRKLSKYEIDLKVYEVARILDLTMYLSRKPGALSGGQRQRVALGRAIVRNPKVFLMDEPLSNLDAKLRVQMRSEIIRIHEQVGATTIYVTHDQTEAMTMADRIVIMKAGYIQQIGKPDVVYNDPANMFVAGFIGSPAMNFFNGHVINGKFVMNGESKFAVDLTAEQKKLLSKYDENTEIVLGVRPEHCHTYDIKDVKLTNKLESKCYLSELLGSDLVIYAKFDDQKISAKTNDQHPVKTHETFEVAFDVTKMYFFEKESGLRIKEAK